MTSWRLFPKRSILYSVDRRKNDDFFKPSGSIEPLAPTIPEEQHWVDREKLLDIQGRRRLPQIELAKKIGVKDYPCPGGGCRLTDPQFAKRMKEAFDHGEYSLKDIQLLKYGRHVRLLSGARVIIGRNEEENKVLLQYMNLEDIALEVIGTGSPITLLQKQKDEDDLRQAATLCIRYSDTKEKEKVKLKIIQGNGKSDLEYLHI